MGSLVTKSDSGMTPANLEMNMLIDKLLNNDLKEDFAAFLADPVGVYYLMIKVHGNKKR